MRAYFLTSSSRCEANNIVVPWAAICLIISLIWWIPWGSRPFVGSSRINISGSFSRQRQWPDVVSSLKKKCWTYCFLSFKPTNPVFPEFCITDVFIFYRLASGFALPSCMDKSLVLSIAAPTFQASFVAHRQMTIFPWVLLTTFETIPNVGLHSVRTKNYHKRYAFFERNISWACKPP
jgi:hypothetical protein